MVSPIIVALDVGTIAEAEDLARPLVDHVAGFKVGLELLTSAGPGSIAAIAAMGRPVFADAKLHDIPNTVERAARHIAAAGARWVTVHASGGRAMMEAAVLGMGEEGVLAVTMLTSLGASDLTDLGMDHPVSHQVIRLAMLAADSGVEGVVCSPDEVFPIREEGIDLTIFTPGVRLEDSPDDDQRRTGTPESAIGDGADYLVIGRPITRAPDPVAAVREIAHTIAGLG